MRRTSWRDTRCRALLRACGAALALGLALIAAPDAHAAKKKPAPKPQTSPEPQPQRISYFYDGFKQCVRPLTRAFDPANGIRKLARNPREAANVDEHDQVQLPSTWWTPRVGFREVPAQAMLDATGSSGAPAEGLWTIVKAKSQGVSPGFQIVDTKGVRWAIKFDPPDFPELTTGADVITSKLYWAAGYNVPSNVIVTFKRSDLTIKPGIKYRDPIKGDLPITDGYIDTLLARVARRPDGAWRAVASRFLVGHPVGEINYEGRRKDDPEDQIPHQLRRELRGMWTVNSWLHHDDCSSRNTLDMFVDDGGRKFVRHYFLDFSGTLGAASISKHSHRSGHEYLLDYGVALKNAVTLGLARPKWEHAVDPDIEGVGFFDSKTFDPSSWRPFLPNAAFDARTDRDIRWGARIVAGFDEPLIRAAVAQGKFTNPAAEDYLVKTLLERRDMIVKRWLSGSVASASAVRESR